MKRYRLTESKLRGMVGRAVRAALYEEIDTGQLPSALEKKQRRKESPREKEIRAELRKLRRLIGEYEEEGRDISKLQQRIDKLKKEAGFIKENRFRGIVHNAVGSVLRERIEEPSGDYDAYVLVDQASDEILGNYGADELDYAIQDANDRQDDSRAIGRFLVVGCRGNQYDLNDVVYDTNPEVDFKI